MSKPKREKFTVSTTSEKPSPEKSFVQVERELTEEQLEAISKRSAEGQCAGALRMLN